MDASTSRTRVSVFRLILSVSVFASNVFCHESAQEAHSRQTRHLVYPDNGSKVQMIVGIGIPVQLPFQALTFGYVLKADYFVPTNGTMYTKPFEAFADITSGRHLDDNDATRNRRELTLPSSRWDLYDILEAVVKRAMSVGQIVGIQNNHNDAARQCVLRAICETAASGFQHDGLLGEMLHVVLTPSTTSEPIRSRRHIDYHVAERLGKTATMADTCAALFSGCESGSLDFISTLLPAII